MTEEKKTKLGKFLLKVKNLLRKEAFNHPEIILRELTNDELEILSEAIHEEQKKRYGV